MIKPSVLTICLNTSNKNSVVRFTALLFILLGLCYPAAAAPTVETYAAEPRISDMELSPNGELVAYTLSEAGKRTIVITSITDGVIRIFDSTENTDNSYEFLGNEHLIVRSTEVSFFPGYSGEYRIRVAFSLNISTGEVQQLLHSGNELRYPQTNLANVIGYSAIPGYLLMSALSGEGEEYKRSVYRVNMETGRGLRIEPGTKFTIDWFIGEDETIYAREDYLNHDDRHSVLTERNGRWMTIFDQEEVDILEGSFSGLSPDKKSILLVDDPSGHEVVYHLSLEDGSLSDPIFSKPGSDIGALIQGWNDEVFGVQYSGLLPTYEFYDAELTEDIAAVVEQWPMNSVVVVSVTEDLSKVLLNLAGSDSSGIYFLLDRTTGDFHFIADQRPDIPIEDVAPLVTMSVEARDGLNIPVILTIPPGVQAPKNMPAIMMPHGGPESYNRIGYHYRAQFFASLGYLVIQPNFRGSSGFGSAHILAGRGEWGAKMQEDLTDTLNKLVDLGAVDPERVCIVGASYGGYSALAGGAFTPDTYKCVVAVAPVTDLHEMIDDKARDIGDDHWAISYWNELIADRSEERDKLENISPVNFADSFTAPVLLIHGDSDTVVPIEQSEIMDRALRRADKDVTFITLKDEDHSLSHEETRFQALRAMGNFVQEHLH